MPLVGLTGPAGAGKSTAARALVDAGWHRVSLAAPLKAMMRALYAHADLPEDEVARRLAGDLKEVPDPVLLGKSPREAMQTLGTEWGRDTFGPIWVSLARRQIAAHMAQGRSVVLDDVRFADEAAMIRAMGGTVVAVTGRGGACANGTHVSEAGVVADLLCDNSGTEAELAGWMLTVFAGRGPLP